MSIVIRKYEQKDIEQMNCIWNEVVDDGIAFPQLEILDDKTGAEFFSSQTYCGVAENDESGEIAGLYILHPNNIGRCGHIANASYAVSSKFRGQKIGRMLVEDCLRTGANYGFKILQFNAVVSTNTTARKLYESLGFVMIGIVPKGFLMKDGHYEDICLYYHNL